jgi:DNA-binding transcriptional MerR regulator
LKGWPKENEGKLAYGLFHSGECGYTLPNRLRPARRNPASATRTGAMATAKKARAKKSADIIIPDKLYFRIGEVAELCDLPTYVLRFWETEFPQLKPTKGSTGQRMYRRRDVENVVTIKHLLYDEGFTIAGARERLKAEARPTKTQTLPFPKKNSKDGIRRVRQGLQEILQILSSRRS